MRWLVRAIVTSRRYPRFGGGGHGCDVMCTGINLCARVVPPGPGMERPPPERRHGDDGSETVALLRAYHERGDSTARRRLVELYLPLVESFARRYAGRTDAYEDLYQVGCIGLINAIDRFEIGRGDELAAFAVPNIAGEIRRHLRDQAGSVRLPRRVQELRAPARRIQGELGAQLGHAPSAAEVARELGADERDVALALDPGAAAVSLDAGPGEGPAAAGDLDATEDRLFLEGAARGLSERERRILHLRFVEDVPAADVAIELAISPRQLSRDTQAALAKLRRGLERGAAPAAEQRAAAAPVDRGRPSAPDPAGDPEPDPEPEDDRRSGRSGRLLLRLPQTLHAELSHAAQAQDVSLNRYITSALERSVAGDRSAERRATRLRMQVAVLLAIAVLAAVLVVVALSR